ncbi:hypothetical protein CPAST_c12550 [Clostridium pasteurianum DSM 525 = ATCC 6013]|uniref:Uncharacterized protein n=1 Tax=Clostridium pasteurianum DSM 525 = ATCC 6013 TaxID=1262449 RepID=A0A0H3J8G8_CLOPA|nr:hypothetical protein CPAST_c12550 [Clostridium pasteurianum DSM 525 = ATCC 6013]AJA51343.1 hypothetical protein CLPA_c12550 [Clostridium pasteurianum DSM 525 = ATCC 6013]KRU12650.1 hypothetical protein CP6013_01898 [Clostridium pasteurianum DSM 525 = ATCC 6013]
MKLNIKMIGLVHRIVERNFGGLQLLEKMKIHLG